MQKKCHYNQFPLPDSLDDPKNEYNPKKHQKIKMVPELQTTLRIEVTLIMRTTSIQNMFQNKYSIKNQNNQKQTQAKNGFL